MGEIGRDRVDTIYEMSYSDIMLVVRGYRRRNVLQYQLLRLNAYISMFIFRENKDMKLPQDIWPLYFDRYKSDGEEEDLEITEEDAKEMQKDILAFKEFLRSGENGNSDE